MPGPDAGLLVTVGGARPLAEDPVPHRVSERELRSWLGDPADRNKVLQMVEAVSGSSPAASPGTFEPDLLDCVRRELERAFRLARLVAVRSQRTERSGPAEAQATGRPTERVTGAAAAPGEGGTDSGDASRASAPSRTWIEVVLVDAAGRPVPGERCRLQLPDGSVRTATLDGDGRLRVDGIDPGTCEVSFPDRDGADWRAA
jgi:hypothetical protein